jgi:hypothetical protein
MLGTTRGQINCDKETGRTLLHWFAMNGLLSRPVTGRLLELLADPQHALRDCSDAAMDEWTALQTKFNASTVIKNANEETRLFLLST